MKKNLHQSLSFSLRGMIASTKKSIKTISLLFLIVLTGVHFASAQEIQENALRQIKSLIDEKESRTPAQKKINSQILYTYKMRNGQPLTSEVATLKTDVVKDANGKIKVDIDADATPQLLNSLKAMGCEIIFSSEKFRNIVANIPLDVVEQVALLDAIKHINPWIAPVNNSDFSSLMRVDKSGNTNNFSTLNLAKKHNNNSVFKFKYAPDFTSRAENVKKQLNEVLGQKELNGLNSVMSFVGLATSEGDIAHKAALARAVFGMNGSGVKIGVLSDSYDTRTTGTNAADDIASGDLPGPGNPNGYTTPVTVLLDSPNGSDEGRAMLQIIHDLAPGAELYFATAFVSQASFAQQILALHAAGCDIIVDDITYYAEAVFQDDNVAQAVNTVTAAGALFFSSAGNSGNKNDNTSGVWEGDFLDAGTATIGSVTIAGGTFHDFSGGVTNNQITLEARVPSLKWSDPLGASGNDYDLYIFDAALSAVVLASTDIQDGNDNPVEALFYVIPAGYRIVIFKKTGAAVRALHLNTNRGRLNFNTPGVTYGHNAAAAAYTVAATPAVTPGPYPGVFNPANSVETFSSDGPRRIFFNPDSTEITPGNVLFGTNGGTLLQKPDITAADGVVTSTPGFARFYGTSAAAPHAAAIAALIKSKLPAITPAEIRTALVNSAIDIETPGADRDAGAGIIMAYEALLAAGALPSFSNLEQGTVAAVEGAYGNGNGTLESGELGSMTVQLMNLSPSVSADDVNAVLTSSTPGVTITRGAADYGDIAGAGSAVNTATPYLFGVNSSISCGAVVNFTLTVTIGSGEPSPKEFNFTVGVGSAAGAISATLGSPPPSGPGYVSLSGTQTGRINRIAPPSTCAVPKIAPGYQSASGGRAYHAYTFSNSGASSQCVSVSMNSTNGSVLFTAAYNNAGFVPATPNINYLADAASSSNAAIYSFTVPAGQQFTVVVHEVNAGGGVGTSYELNVGLKSCDAAPLCTDVVISTASIQNGTTGVPYNQSFSATGGSGSYLFSLSGTLPTGLSFTGNTLSGTPTETGSFPIIVTATDATGCPQGTQNYTLDITVPTITTIESNLNPSLTGNTVAFTATVTSNGNPVTSGTVTFTEGPSLLSGPTAVNPDGQASFLISSLVAGNHDIKATYNGTVDFAASNGTVTQIVNDPIVTYSITTTAGTGGSITASSVVNSGDNATVTVTPDACYRIVSVLVDGVAADLSALNLNLPYDVIFSNVTANHTVTTTFAINTYTIIASAGANGTITPNGSTTVNCGANQTFNISPDACYQVADVLVDGVSVGAVSSFTFTDVNANRTISATFSQLTVTPVITGPTTFCEGSSITLSTALVDGASYCWQNTAAAPSWMNVGAAGFSAGTGEYQSLKFSGTTPYVAYTDWANGNKTTVMKFNGTDWENVGAAGFSAGYTNWQSLAFSGTTPYVAYYDGANGSKTTVMKFNGTNWEYVGTAGFSAGLAYYQSLAFSGTTPYVAYNDGANGGKTTVMKFNGTNWENVGTAGFSAGEAYYPSLAFSGSTPYVAYYDGVNGGKTTVMKFNGTNWENVGTAGFSAGEAFYQSLAFSGTTPYVAYSDYSNGYKTTVMKFNGTNWENVGAGGFSAGTAFYQSLAFSGITPYVAYNDGVNGGKTTVMKFNGTGWEYAGAAGFSGGTSYHQSLAFSGSIPYVAYRDGANGGKTTVMKLDPCLGNTTALNVTAAGNYTVTVTNSSGCSATSAPVTVNTFSQPNYTITASAGSNGTITPNGTTIVNCGDDQTFTIAPDDCYQVADVLVDGVSQGVISSYTFTNVTSAHTINATFSQLSYEITASAGSNGTITPNGPTIVNCGDDQTFTIAPDACYQVEDVLVDGVSQGAISTYTFTNVTSVHTISATFSQLSYAITASAGANGSITPNGTTTVNCGASQIYTIVPGGGFAVQNVLVDGVSQGAITTYTFSNVTAPHTISATFVASALCSATGNISYQVWNNIGSSYSISSLTGNINYPNNPTSSTLITTMEAPPTVAYQFGARIAGYICAPATGNYTFWIASDNAGELWLSTDEQPANKLRIAYHNGYTSRRGWNKYATQKSVQINLVQGQKYYIEALMKQVWGGSCQVVGWLKPGQSGSVPSEVIPGSVLSPIGPIQTILVSSVTLPPVSDVNVGSTVLIPATVLPVNATNSTLAWSTGNPAIATVNSNGLVTGMAVGNVTITATSTDGSNISGSCVVTVNAVPAVCSATGNISYQVWNNIGSSYSISSLTGNSNYPNNPTSSTLITTMEAPLTVAYQFGARIAGYICAPATGNYTFWIASDNAGELWLSTDEQPANKLLIAYHNGYTSPRGWNKYASQKSVQINLVQGQKYYIEALMKQVWGGSCQVVGWLKPGQSGTVPSEVIPGSVLSPLVLPVKTTELNVENPTLFESDVTLLVYPNPVTNNDAVNLKLENLTSDATLRIFTITGVKCYEEIIQNSGIIQVDRSVFKSGMYILKVENEDFVKTTKLIVN